MDGGIFGLLGLIARHRGAVEYDLRARFGFGLRQVDGDHVTLSEVARLIRILRDDPSSAIVAALQGWDYPIDRTTLAIYDLFDWMVLVNSDAKKSRPKPHGGRPFKIDDSIRERVGNAGGRTPLEVARLLGREPAA